MRILAYILSQDVKCTYEVPVNQGMATSPLQASWSYVVHAILSRFLTEEKLHFAHHAVSRADQGTLEDETQLAQQI